MNGECRHRLIKRATYVSCGPTAQLYILVVHTGSAYRYGWGQHLLRIVSIGQVGGCDGSPSALLEGVLRQRRGRPSILCFLQQYALMHLYPTLPLPLSLSLSLLPTRPFAHCSLAFRALYFRSCLSSARSGSADLLPHYIMYRADAMHLTSFNVCIVLSCPPALHIF